MIGFLENISQWIKYLWQRSSSLLQRSSTRSVYVTFTFPFVSVKRQSKQKKKKKKKKAIVIALLSLLDQTVLPSPG